LDDTDREYKNARLLEDKQMGILSTLSLLNKAASLRSTKVDKDKSKYQIPERFGSLWNTQQMYLDVLKRELANLIMNEDLDAFEQNYYKLIDYENELKNSSIDRSTIEHLALMEKYQDFSDFDAINTKDYIKYSTSNGCGSSFSSDLSNFINVYNDISKFFITYKVANWQKLKSIKGNENSEYFKYYDDHTVEIFRERIKKYKDTKFASRIKKAIDAFSNKYYNLHDPHFHKIVSAFDDEKIYEDPWFRVEQIPGGFNYRAYSIVLKDTDEFGIYEIESGFEDPNTGKFYYRSNIDFKDKEHLYIDNSLM
jgi:hypothetical protein